MINKLHVCMNLCTEVFPEIKRTTFYFVVLSMQNKGNEAPIWMANHLLRTKIRLWRTKVRICRTKNKTDLNNILKTFKTIPTSY